MAKRNGVISLQGFLHKYFDKVGIDEDEYLRYYKICADGLRHMHIHHLPIITTTTLTVDSTNLTADFPDDFIDYLFLAIEMEGRWWTFTRDTRMVDKTISGITGADLGDYDYIPGFGAVGGGNSHYFDVDYVNRRFLFSGVTTTDVVVLKYKSTGVENVSYSSTTDVEFPVYAEDAMEDYLRWKICEYDNGPSGECERRKKHFDDSVLMMRNLHSPTIEEIRDIWLGSSNQSIIRS